MTNVHLTRSAYSAHKNDFIRAEDVYEGWVILAVESGRFIFSIGEEEPSSKEAGFGDLVICPPKLLLKRKALEPVSFHFIEFNLDGECPQGKILVRDQQRLTSTFNYLRQISVEPLEDQYAFANHLIHDLLLVISREQQRLVSENSREKADPLIARAHTFMDLHAFESEWNMQSLAENLGISSSQLTRRFQNAYSISPIEYITTLRLQKARTLLVDTDHTVDHIAELCGYQNGFYLSRIFSAKLKIGPSAYRRTYRF